MFRIIFWGKGSTGFQKKNLKSLFHGSNFTKIDVSLLRNNSGGRRKDIFEKRMPETIGEVNKMKSSIPYKIPLQRAPRGIPPQFRGCQTTMRRLILSADTSEQRCEHLVGGCKQFFGVCDYTRCIAILRSSDYKAPAVFCCVCIHRSTSNGNLLFFIPTSRR